MHISVYLCMRVCSICVWMVESICVRVLCIHTRIPTCMSKVTYIYACMHTYMCVRACVRVYFWVYVCVCYSK
jgi:hypothetical protein